MAVGSLCYLEFRLPQDCSRTVGGRSSNPTVPGQQSTAQTGTALTFSGSFRPHLCGSFDLSLKLPQPAHAPSPLTSVSLSSFPETPISKAFPNTVGFLSSVTFLFLKNQFSVWQYLVLQVPALTLCVLDLCRLKAASLRFFLLCGLGVLSPVLPS